MSKRTLSVNQAAQAAHTSRSAIMRALANKSLFATRDNKNRWQISQDDLDKWMRDRPTTVRIMSEPKPDMSADLASARTEVRMLRENIVDLKAAHNKQIDDLRSDHARDKAMMIEQLTQPRSLWARIWKSRS